MTDLEAAHKHSINHRDEVLASETCGCFWCCRRFTREALGKTTDEGRTFLCPLCGIDAVIGCRAGYPLSNLFLNRMRERWFGGLE